jgi:hypothetical protein
MRRFCAFLLAFPLVLQAGSTEPPVRERLDLRLLTLNRLVLQAAPEHKAGLLPANKSQLPLSVQLYLKPSGALNHLSQPIQKAAAKIRRQIAPGAKQKDRLRESPRVAEAVRAYLDEALPLSAIAWSSDASTDLRMAWPKASEILAAGKADAEGRARVAVSLLRALGVPARTAWARGQLTAQYWVALQPEPKTPTAPKPKGKAKKAKGVSAPKPPLGWWEPLDPALDPVEIDAWSLDAGVLGRILWEPEQQLSLTGSAWERVVFAEGDSAAARAAYDASLSLGRLTQTAGALQSLSAAARAAAPGATLWVLTWQRYQLETEGAMASMDPFDVLSPYRPHLASWGRELPSRVHELECEAQGYWSDRPKHLRGDAAKPRDEWKSPPPALGVLHYASTGVRRMSSVLQAKRDGDQLSGKLLRADNLSPRASWDLGVYAPGTTLTTHTVSSDSEGRFGLSLTAEEQSLPWVELATPFEHELQWKGDHQRLERP